MQFNITQIEVLVPSGIGYAEGEKKRASHPDFNYSSDYPVLFISDEETGTYFLVANDKNIFVFIRMEDCKFAGL